MENSYVFEKQSSGLVKEGEYEATIQKIERKTLPSGKEKLSIQYRIRSDVEQAYGNKIMFEDIWSERENPQFFNRKRLNQLLGTQSLKDGTVFNSIEDIMDFLLGANLIIVVGIEFDEYHSQDVNVVSYYRSSKAKAQELKVEKPTVNITSDDLPF